MAAFVSPHMGPVQEVEGAVVAILGAVLGWWVRRWALAYARLLRIGSAPVARTLWVAGWRAGAMAARPWCDGVAAVGLGAGAAAVSMSTASPALAVFWLVLCGLAWLDWHSGLLPDALSLPLWLAGIVSSGMGLTSAGLASVSVWLAFVVLALGYRRWRGEPGLGGGDVKCLAAMAAWLGVVPALTILWGACVLGLLVHVLGRCRRRAYPFGPCLAAAAWPVLLAGPAVHSWF